MVSPSDTFREVEERAAMWLSHGARVVWVVEPDSRRVLVYESGKDRRDLTLDEVLETGDILPGFSVPVTRLFP